MLRRLGLIPEPVQPDVSASTILHLLLQTQGQSDLIRPALGALHEEVHVITEIGSASEPYRHVALDLWRDAQPYATVQCETFANARLPDLRAQLVSSPLSELAQLPLTSGHAHRVSCVFQY